MDQQHPLLSGGFQDADSSAVPHENITASSASVSAVRWTLKIVMWVVFIIWILSIFVYPLVSGNDLIKEWTHDLSVTFLGVAGAVFMVYSGPIIVIAILSAIYFLLNKEDEHEQLLQEQMREKKISRSPKYKMWTFPVLVEGLFGVVSAAELLWMLLFVLYIVWAAYVYTSRNIEQLAELDLETFQEKSTFTLSLVALSLSLIGIFLLGFLFVPITRGSTVLRLIDIPFEQAARYHVWLGHLTMVFFTLHGLFYIIAWTFEGELLANLLLWEDTGVANLAGVIGLTAGLMMWITSLSIVRRKNFELFYYTHYLYVIFIIFLALHVGAIFLSFVAGGVFLFMLDRLLRFFQSRTTVDIVSATCFPCETVELVLSKPKNLSYNALGFVFLQVRESSWLQWHPFSVTSSPEEGDSHLSILIKVRGEWTKRLKEKILHNSDTEHQNLLQIQECPTLTASIEGPYGHVSPYHLMYERLILVAGGIGISPHLAILRDIFHRIQLGKSCLPKNILVVWAIQRSNELCLLSRINNVLSSESSSQNSGLNFEMLIYITRESDPSPLLEEGADVVNEAINYTVRPIPRGSSISGLVATGNKKWNAVYVISPVFGFLILLSLMNIFYVNPNGVTAWQLGILFLGCMLVSVLMFGAIVIGLWYVSERRVSELDQESDKEVSPNTSGTVDRDHGHSSAAEAASKYSHQNFLANSATLRYGSRPNFREIFRSMSEGWGSVDVGFFVCGPPSLDSSVAEVCRSHNLSRSRNQPIFHFHTLSFDL